MAFKEQLIISEDCIGCGQCVKVCIRGHLSVKDGKATEVDSDYYCFRCGHCASVCPKGAIKLKDFIDYPYTPIKGSPVDSEELASLYRFRRSTRWFDRPCTEEELSCLLRSIGYAPTAENSQKVQYAVVDQSFGDFMVLLASILRSHRNEHPRLDQFVKYVDDGMKEKNNPFTWEGRQLIIAFARFPIDAIIPIAQLDLMASAMGLGGFHSRWMLQAAENDPEKFMSFFPEIEQGLCAYAVYVVGHPRIRFRREVPRDERKVIWM
ncbi:MAG: 4Fe-4S binding protein [Candidatus Methanomethylophilaceae archaeon]|nr:4Fe-4S binding protein [Candidatus Methanomethylophilaceae archaeon]MBR6214367.1 4Fe-4S binding protein [Candidatus Methanomethylophilaceae archaeon]